MPKAESLEFIALRSSKVSFSQKAHAAQCSIARGNMTNNFPITKQHRNA